MRGFLAVARREIEEKRFVFAAAAVPSLIPFAVPLVRGLHGSAATEARDWLALILAATFAVGLATALGATVVASDLAERRLGFYFSRPISGLAIWAGKLGAACLMALGTAAIVYAPTLAANGGRVILIDFPQRTPETFILGAAAAVVLSHAVAIALRPRSHLLGFDLLALVLLTLGALFILRRLALAFAIEALHRATISLLLVALVGTLAAGLVAVVQGRTDAHAAHRALSATLWGIVGAGVLSLGGYASWVLSATPRDLKEIDSALPASRGSWVIVNGPARGSEPVFLFDTAAGGDSWQRENRAIFLADLSSGQIRQAAEHLVPVTCLQAGSPIARTISRSPAARRQNSSMATAARSCVSIRRPAKGVCCSERPRSARVSPSPCPLPGGEERDALLSSRGVTGFLRRETELTCDGVSLLEIARAVGTPVYVYSSALIEENYRRFDAAFSKVDHLVCYATKANSNLSILRCLAALGAGADVVSGGELRAALEAGIPSDRIVFSGVGKAEAEIAAGVAASLLAFNAESERELEKISAGATTAGRTARVALRVNPDIDAKTHPYISTGLKHNKFGIDIARARAVYEMARGLPGLRPTGVQAHIGSQITDAAVLAEAAGDLAHLARELLDSGFPLETLDVGGGVGIATDQEPGLSPETYAAAVLPEVAGLPLKILIEPGRAITGPAGALLTRVLDVKENGGKLFVVTDAGMNDLIRPALYDAAHPIEAVLPRGQECVADVVGPVCESSDVFARDKKMDRPREGDLLAIRDAGAYGFAMSSNYNFRTRAAEVLVEKGSFRIVRRRETFEDLVRFERD